MKTVVTRIGSLVVMVILGACSPQQAPAPQPVEPPDTRAADEAAIRAAAAEAATLMLGNAPDFKGATAIRETAGGMMQDANFALSFEPTAVQVARSGDMAYELGTYSMTTTNPKTRKPATA